MKSKRTGYLVTVLSLLLASHDLLADNCEGRSTRQLSYRQDNGPAYQVTQTRDGQRLTIRYQNRKSLNGQPQAPDVTCVRNLKTGRLESCETFPDAGSRRYDFTAEGVKLTLPGGRVSTHKLTTVAHPQLLDAICAFVASGADSQRVSYISQAESFGTQGFLINRDGTESATTPAGTFKCSKVKLTLDSRIGALFFRLDFLVASDAQYPFIVKGRTSTGGDFQLTRIE